MISDTLLDGVPTWQANNIKAAFIKQRDYYEDGIKEAAIRVGADQDDLVGLAQMDALSDLLTAQTRLRDTLLDFASSMEGQLRANLHKGDSWPEIPCSVHFDHVAVQISKAGRALIDGRKADARRHMVNAANYIFFACIVSTSQ